MTWRLPDTYHSAGNGQGTATLKFYEGRDNLHYEIATDVPDRHKLRTIFEELAVII
jgi:hypothetical protein